jgi:hypothetical protein
LAVDVYEIFREIRILVSKIRYVGQRLRFQITLPKDLTEVQMQIFVGFFIFPWHLVVK